MTASDAATYIIEGLPFAIVGIVEWYRNHPDNILARAISVINGGTAKKSSVTAVVESAPNESKIAAVAAIEDVAAVVVKPTAANGTAKIAADPAQPKVITQ